MTIEISYTQARKQLASLLDEVTDNCEVVKINRSGKESVALISAAELARVFESVEEAVVAK